MNHVVMVIDDGVAHQIDTPLPRRSQIVLECLLYDGNAFWNHVLVICLATSVSIVCVCVCMCVCLSERRESKFLRLSRNPTDTIFFVYFYLASSYLKHLHDYFDYLALKIACHFPSYYIFF